MNEPNEKTLGPLPHCDPISREELLELHKRVLERVRAMSPEEGFQSLVASGIYTPDGQLAKEYGG